MERTSTWDGGITRKLDETPSFRSGKQSAILSPVALDCFLTFTAMVFPTRALHFQT